MGNQSTGSDPGPDPIDYTIDVPFILNVNSAGKVWESNQAFTLTLKDSVFTERDDGAWINGTLTYSTDISTSYNGKWYYEEGNEKIYVSEGDSITFSTGGVRTFYACYFTDMTVTHTLPALQIPPNQNGDIINYKWVLSKNDNINRVPSYDSNIFESKNVKIFPLPEEIQKPPNINGIYTDFSVTILDYNNSQVLISTTAEIQKIGLLVEVVENTENNTYTYQPIIANGQLQAIYPFTNENAQAQADANGVISSIPEAGKIRQVSIVDLNKESLLIENITAEDISSTYEFKYIESTKEVYYPPIDITLSTVDTNILAIAYWSYNLNFYSIDNEILLSEAHDCLDSFTIYYPNIEETFTGYEDAVTFQLSRHATLKDKYGNPYIIPEIREIFNQWLNSNTQETYQNGYDFFKNNTYYNVYLTPLMTYEPVTVTLPYAVAYGATFQYWTLVPASRSVEHYNAGSAYTAYEPTVFSDVWSNVVYRIYDSDYIGFTIWDSDDTLLFDSMAEGIYRVSDSSRYNENLLPNFTDKTQVAPGGDGTYYFTSQYTNRQISFPIAYDNLTEEKKKKLVTILARKKPYWLVFDEYPYKKYLVKAQSVPAFKWVPFNRSDNSRVYKGEGTLNFICYTPFAISRFKYKNEFEEDYLNRNIISMRVVLDKTNSHLIDLATNGQLLIKGYLSTQFLNKEDYGYYQLTVQDVQSMSDAEISNTVFYYWQYGNIDEWMPDAVNLLDSQQGSGTAYDQFSGTTHKLVYLYNPGDLETDFILEFEYNGASSNTELQLYANGAYNTKMIFNLAGIEGNVVLDTKQHCLYLKAEDGSVQQYLNDKIKSGDFFKIPTYDQKNKTGLRIRMRNASGASSATIKYNYLYY